MAVLQRYCPVLEPDTVKILLTGAAGFIGMYTALRLLERGDQVVGVDNLNSYYDVGLKEARLARLTDDLLTLSRIEAGKLELNLQPVSVADLVEACLETTQFRVVGMRIHLAMSGFIH